MSDKLTYLRPKNLNPADELRQLLTSLEDRQPRVKRLTSTQALILLRDLDQAYYLFEKLRPTGLNLLAEEGRFQVVQGHYKDQARPILRALGGAAALSDYRPRPAPIRERWWWYIHELVATQQKRWVRYGLTITLAIVLVVGGIVLAFNTILAPDPVVLVRFDIEQRALDAIDHQNYSLALEIVEQGQRELPEPDAGILILEGMLHDLSGQSIEAEQTFEQAMLLLDDPLIFHLALAQLYLRADHPEDGRLEARAAIALNEESARGWLLLGQAFEAQEERFKAVLAYEKAGSLAFDQGENEIVVMARLALSRLGPSDLQGVEE